MKSFRNLQERLPKEFLDRIYAEYGQVQAEKILAGYMTERPITLRVNTLKTEVRAVMRQFQTENLKFERVSWYQDALILKNCKEKDLATHPLYEAGQIYLQSLSSMIPPLILDPKPGQKILDLTAAPGSKSTQLAALMQNQGELLANELNEIRAERLKFNVDRQGASMIQVRHGDGKHLEAAYEGAFDAVLLDAPCSGEGLFLVDESRTYRGWSMKKVRELAAEQKKLFRTAWWALKPGGTMVYSTCTLAKEENEGVLEWALAQYPELKLINLPLHLPQHLLDLTKLSQPQQSSLRIYPSLLMEGFFVARFQKSSL